MRHGGLRCTEGGGHENSAEGSVPYQSLKRFGTKFMPHLATWDLRTLRLRPPM